MAIHQFLSKKILTQLWRLAKLSNCGVRIFFILKNPDTGEFRQDLDALALVPCDGTPTRPCDRAGCGVLYWSCDRQYCRNPDGPRLRGQGRGGIVTGYSAQAPPTAHVTGGGPFRGPPAPAATPAPPPPGR